jgi:hypothetical protein
MYLGICGSFNSAKNNWARISQIRKCHIHGTVKNLKKLKSDLRICDFRNLFVDRPLLQFVNKIKTTFISLQS